MMRTGHDDTEITDAANGFGNVLLINGQTTFSGEAALGEVVRLYLVNTANTRIFNVAVRGARAKLIGGDSGRYERETFVDAVLLAPSERAVIDVLFDTPGGGAARASHSRSRLPPRRVRGQGYARCCSVIQNVARPATMKAQPTAWPTPAAQRVARRKSCVAPYRAGLSDPRRQWPAAGGASCR
jgi:FtsP/CotA-like multicopper oxidase with cupredoxin domain